MLLWLLGSGLAQAGEPAPAVISADLISAEDGVATGTGSVVIVMGDQRATGQRFVLDLDDGSLVVESGTWTRDEGVLAFGQAEIDLGDLSGVVLEARFTSDRFTAEGRVLTFLDEDLTGSEVTISVCGCPEGAPQTWDVTARSVSVRIDDVAWFTGGWIRVCERRLLPVPAGIVVLAERRTGLLPPELGYGVDGLQAAAPIFLAASDHADLTVTPAWRAERGLRGLSEARLGLAEGEGTVLRGALGLDTTVQSWRGASDLQHAWTPGVFRTAIDSQYWSDLDYQSDYGGDFLSRAAPWTESLAVAEARGVRLESDTFQANSVTTQRPIAGVVTHAGGRGGLSAWGQVRVDRFADGTDPAALVDARLRGQGTGALAASQRWDWLQLTSALSAQGVAWADESPWASGSAHVQAMVPMWGDLGGLRHLAAVGMAGSLATWSDGAQPVMPDEDLPHAASFGPKLTSRWVTAGGVPISAVASLPWTPDGLDPQVAARLQYRQLSGRVQLEDTLAAGSIGWSGAPGQVSLSAAHADDITQGSLSTRWWIPGVPIAAGWRHLANLEQSLSFGPTLGYRSPCDCLDIQAAASWSVDRDLPDVGLQLRIR